jgi:hypothetical protein
LPPQSARFREMSRRTASKSEPTPFAPSGAQAPPAPQDGIMPRVTNADSSLPLGPRNQPQVATPRETSHPDLRTNARLPPSGPSAASTSRSRRHDAAFNAKQQPSTSRDRSAMNVDSVPPAKPPPIRINDMPIRANSGMYADREQQRVDISISTDAAPRGPRAMNRMPTSSSTPSFAPSPSTSPTSLLHPQRLGGNQEHTDNRLRQRSPPPHMVASSSFQPRDARFSGGGMQRQNVPAIRESSDRGQLQHGPYQEAEPRDQVSLVCQSQLDRCLLSSSAAATRSLWLSCSP